MAIVRLWALGGGLQAYISNLHQYAIFSVWLGSDSDTIDYAFKTVMSSPFFDTEN